MSLLKSILGRGFRQRDNLAVAQAPRLGEAMALQARVTPVVSSTGGALYADNRCRLVAVAGNLGPEAGSVVAAIFPDRPGFAFLLRADATTTIGMDRDSLEARVLSYAVRPAGPPDTFVLKHPNRNFFVCAAPGAPGQPVDISCNRDAPGNWEELHAGPDMARSIAAPTSDLLAAMARALAREESGDAFCQWLMAEPDGVLAACGQAILRTLEHSTLAEIGFKAATDAQTGARLRSILPDDPWTEIALPELGRWLHDRRPVGSASIDPSLDFLGHDYVYWRGTGSITSTVTTLTRTKVGPRRKLAVLATARNEGIYFLQWIAHYRALGVEHFFLYSNDNNDGSDALLSALADSGEITWIDNKFVPGVDGQLKAYSHCLSFMPNILDYRWTLLVDLDEFLVLDTGIYGSLPDLLTRREAEGATVVAFSWLFFAMGRSLSWNRLPLLERCTEREPGDNSAVKSAFLTRNFIASYPHDPTPALGVPVVYRDAAGRPHHWEGRDKPPSNGQPLYEHAWINHYFFKSVEEYLWKTSRNRGGYELTKELRVKPETIAAFARWTEPVASKPDLRAHRHLAGLQTEMRRLMALPGVSAAEDAVEEKFTAMVEQLREEALSGLESAPIDPEVRSRVVDLLSRTEDAGRGSSRPLVATGKA